MKKEGQMDSNGKRDWSWVPKLMPQVARLMKAKRLEYGDAHVNECWARGIAGEPGYFFAWEGPVSIGTPWDKAVMDFYTALPATRAAMLFIRNPEAAHGAD